MAEDKWWDPQSKDASPTVQARCITHTYISHIHYNVYAASVLAELLRLFFSYVIVLLKSHSSIPT